MIDIGAEHIFIQLPLFIIIEKFIINMYLSVLLF